MRPPDLARTCLGALALTLLVACGGPAPAPESAAPGPDDSWQDAFYAASSVDEAIQITEDAGLRYRDYDALMEQNSQLGNHEVIVALADASLRFANAEAYQVDSPQIGAVEATIYGPRRIAFSMAHKARAQVALDDIDGALASYAEGAASTHRDFLGVDETPLHSSWARLLFDQGEPERAMEVLGVDGIHGDPGSRDLYRQAWIAARGSEEGLEEHLWTLRHVDPPRLGNTTLLAYDRTPLDLGTLQGEVVLLAFWFPT